ncbi:putative inactive disease susceptibility protein LOV1 [Ziziphus jujuba]|uniref:Inactive disease susceptibility protein LOV1 n=1 Tax=Ziziphus jujuba TaxID=326968 RepID=A0ABM4AG74_ZIZJJ|nr:putative inactive disease susceptibility protein LOV1 [Ziziphus jujuba]
MAEFLLSKLAESAVSHTVQRISDLLIHEASSLRSVREDVVLLQNELRSLQGFVKDADSKQEHDQRLRELVHQVKDVASEAEDVIDTHILKVTSSYIKAFHNKRIRPQVNSLRSRIHSIINTSMQIYGFKSVIEEGNSSMVELQRYFRRSSPNDDDGDNDDVMVSLKGSINALTAELTKEEDRLCIVSVVGMGGLGKTTLAKKVYNGVKPHFDCSAWVFISQKYVVRDVLIDISTQLDSPNEDMNFEIIKSGWEIVNALTEHELIDLLRHKLKEKRFLVVLDDIWTIVAWDFLKRAFPKGKKGSKVLFTTRNREVATYGDPWSSPIEPPFLTLEESWELLRRKAFPRDIVGERCCPPEYENLGKEMAKKCGGLPLAVVVLGGLLKAKNSLDQWKKVLQDVNSHVNKLQSRQQYEGVNEILLLSYHDLPYNLKPCFLYLGNFPEDYEIPKRKLVRLWIGEGFISTSTRADIKQTLGEAAEGYLEELVDRCMVMVDRSDRTGKKTCCMHDLMRDVCTLKAKEETFAQIIQQHESNKSIDISAASSLQVGSSSHSRRLVIHPGCDLHCNTQQTCTFFGKHVKNASWMEQVHANLRTLLCLGGSLSLSALNSSNFRMLRVLELCVAGGSKIPRGVGNLIHLRYLCINSSSKTAINLPSSLGNLRNLQTLDLGRCNLAGPVRMISRMIHLRRLILPHVSDEKWNFDWSDVGIDELKDIETLKRIPASVLIRYDALNKLTNLRKLQIYFDGNNIHDDIIRVLRSPIVESGCLRSLCMRMPSNHVFPSLESLSSCHSLTRIGLIGKISEGMHSIISITVTKLTLLDSQLEQDPMPVLEKLPNLRFLFVGRNAYVGSRMDCSADGFPRLEFLGLYD